VSKYRCVLNVLLTAEEEVTADREKIKPLTLVQYGEKVILILVKKDHSDFLRKLLGLICQCLAFLLIFNACQYTKTKELRSGCQPNQ
jgi:hypothetical protein